MNLAPQFCATLVHLLAEHGLTRLAAADKAGLSRPVFTRLIRGEQWPQPDQLAAISNLATTDAERRALLDGIAADIAEELGVSRFVVAEDDGGSLLRVPPKDAALISDVALLIGTDATARVMLETMVPTYLRKICRDADAEELRKPMRSPRKNTGAPTARPSLPPRAKAS